MGRASPMQTAFNGGELSPYLKGRPDVGKFGVACEKMENWFPLVEGPAVTRPGTRYVGEAKDSAARTWLMRFEFSADDSYMLEFGNQYIRFFKDRAQLQVSGVAAWVTATPYNYADLVQESGTYYYCKVGHTSGTFATDLAAGKWYALTGTHYEIPSPYTTAQLTDSSGAFALRFVQTGDVIYIVHPDVFPTKLSRLDTTEWTLTAVGFVPPPFKDQNTTSTTIYSSATTGSVTLTASASLFASDMVSQWIYLGEKDVRDVQKWEAGVAVALNALRRYDGKNYKALNAATTGGSPPIHSSGAEYDGGVQWQFEDAGYGYAVITGYTSPTVVTASVQSQIPDGAVTSGHATTRWALQAWNDTDGYPTEVTFFRERLLFARDEQMWFSVAADFENFETEIDGVITSDAGFNVRLSSDRANSIRWLSPGDVLLVGTIGDEWAITESTTSDPFGPDNVKTKRQSTYGSNTVSPKRVGAETLFVQRSGTKVRAMAFRYEEDGFASPNVAAFNRTITKGGIVDMAYQQEQFSVLWMVRADGMLLGLTLDREQEVVAWHRHPFAGGAVECVETIPSPDGLQDDLWLIVRYTINGATQRFIAYLTEVPTEDTAQEDWIESDMAAVYDGAPATVISGLDHLEGEEVWILADGGRVPNETVTGGQITLSDAASKVVVGLPCEATLITTNIEGGNPEGTSHGKTKRAAIVTLRLYNSLGGRAGPTEDKLEEIRYRYPVTPMGSAPPPFTGDQDVEWPADYDKEFRVVVKKDRPMPMTLLAVMPQMVVQSGR